MITPYHLADVSRQSGIPMWNPDDPAYFLHDGGMDANPYLQDYIRYHIPIPRGVIEKAWTQDVVRNLQSEPGGGIQSVSHMPDVERMKTGTTPGGMSGALSDARKIGLANATYDALKVNPKTGVSELLAPVIGRHRIRFSGPAYGAWEEGGSTHLDPHIAIDVPHNPADPNHHRNMHDMLADLFQQTAIGSEIHRPKGNGPNAIGIRAHFDTPFTPESAQALAMDIVKTSGAHGHGPEVYPGENFARAIMYPWTAGQPLSEPREGTISQFQTGTIPARHLEQVSNNARMLAAIMRKHGARDARIFGLRTDYNEPSGLLPRNITQRPEYQSAMDVLSRLRGSFGVQKGMDEASDEERNAKVEKVMREFKEGRLRSSSGELVTDRDQAIAIAMSESGQSKD